MTLQEKYDAAFALLEAAVDVDKAGQGSIAAYEAALASFETILALEEAPQRRAVLKVKLREHRERLAKLRTAQGDAAFKQAIKLDEQGQDCCCEVYMAAAEMYLTAIKLLERDSKDGDGDGEARRLKARVAKLLDRVELKKTGRRPQPEALPPPPVSSSLTATCGLDDLPLPPTTLPPMAPAPTVVQAPASGSDESRPPKLTSVEIEVLKRSSVINGRVFLPWLDGEELLEDFTCGEAAPFSDPDGLFHLSPQQAARLGGWKRPSQFVGPDHQPPRIIKAISPFSIEQDIVGDCSFIASLIICAAYERRHRKQLVSKILFPQDAQGQPVYNAKGKYMVKLWANGCARKVIVDDRLPVDRNGELLCACSKDRAELWVSIIEKAYMKLHGASYDFKGSNSGVDLFSLTGWIPEQVFFQEDETGAASSAKRTPAAGTEGGKQRPPPPVLDHRQSAERAWERLQSAFRFGDCLTTIATSASLGEKEAEALGLVPGHAYAVLDVRECLGKRFLLVKNPWARRSWTGPYSSHDRARWAPELCAALGYDPEVARKTDDGVFWIDWVHARRYFNHLFLNWNPDLFLFRTFTHALWPAAIGPKNDSISYAHNPQYLLTLEKGGGGVGSSGGIGVVVGSGSVWILLTRHVTAEEELGASDYLTMHAYRGGKGRVIYPSEGRLCQGVYSNNPHVLTRLDVEDSAAGDGDVVGYTLVLSQYEKAHDVTFTLSVFSTRPFTLRPAPQLPPVVAQLEGVWDSQSAGGRLGQRGFMHNPQFRLVVTRPSRLFVELLAPKEFFVSFSLLGGHRGGRRVDSILQGEEQLTSGTYRQGYCYAEASVPPGAYTAIVSTYEAGLTGAFVLNARGEAPLQQATSILPEGDGMVKQVLRGAWSAIAGTAGGSRPPLYVQNPTFVVSCSERARVLMRLLACTGANEPINVTLFQEASSSLPPQVYATAEGAGVVASAHRGIYTACASGVALPTVELDAGVKYLAVLACYNEGVDADFELIVYSSSRKLIVTRMR